MQASPPMSYCGPPPLPHDLWARWNFDPALLMVMGAIAALFLYRHDGTARQRASFLCGMAVLAVIFVSPLCALTVALFSARIVHHVLLVAVAAPLLAVALIGRSGGPARAPMLPRLLTPMLLLHTAIFWLWHAPDAYASALTSTPVYVAMQLSLLVSAVAFWGAALQASTARCIAALLAMTVQMGLLGALLVFAEVPLYWPHYDTTQAYGLSALADQQLGGLVMWVPAGLPYLAMAVLRLWGWLRQAEVRRA